MTKKANKVRKISDKVKLAFTDPKSVNQSLVNAVEEFEVSDEALLEQISDGVRDILAKGYSLQVLQTVIKKILDVEISIQKIRTFAIKKGYITKKVYNKKSAPVTKVATPKVEQKKEEVNYVNKLKNDMDQLQAIELGDTKSI